tara:strand:+ start:53743 stop:54420 length:678 start_codon:yes stop_codon:yes gene_type:complete
MYQVFFMEDVAANERPSFSREDEDKGGRPQMWINTNFTESEENSSVSAKELLHLLEKENNDENNINYTEFLAPIGIIIIGFLILMALSSSGNGEDGGVLLSAIFFCALPMFYLISVINAIVKLGWPFFIGFMIPIIVIFPLSILSYLNEIENGCLSFGFPGSSGCPPDPPGYNGPRNLFFLFSTLIGLFACINYAWKKEQSIGIFYGFFISTLMFMFATIYGLFG